MKKVYLLQSAYLTESIVSVQIHGIYSSKRKAKKAKKEYQIPPELSNMLDPITKYTITKMPINEDLI